MNLVQRNYYTRGTQYHVYIFVSDNRRVWFKAREISTILEYGTTITSYKRAGKDNRVSWGDLYKISSSRRSSSQNHMAVRPFWKNSTVFLSAGGVSNVIRSSIISHHEKKTFQSWAIEQAYNLTLSDIYGTSITSLASILGTPTQPPYVQHEQAIESTTMTVSNSYNMNNRTPTSSVSSTTSSSSVNFNSDRYMDDDANDTYQHQNMENVTTTPSNDTTSYRVRDDPHVLIQNRPQVSIHMVNDNANSSFTNNRRYDDDNTTTIDILLNRLDEKEAMIEQLHNTLNNFYNKQNQLHTELDEKNKQIKNLLRKNNNDDCSTI